MPMLNKKQIVQYIFGLIIVGCIFSALSYAGKPAHKITNKETNPNVIIILTDDQGYADVGFNGCKDIPTPNIDRIAKNGVVFRNAYVSYAVCAPSRAGLLTGRYQDRFGYSRNPLYKPLDSTIGVPVDEQMLPDFLKRSGYRTMAIGKWHLGAEERFRPWNRGFDDFFGFLGGGHRYFPADFNNVHQDSAKNEEQSYRTKLIRNKSVVEENEYLTEAFSREAVSYIENNKDQPFFLYLAYNAPHGPLQATSKYLDRFDEIKNPKRKTYAAMVSAVDDGVGSILDKLQQLNLTENTIVIFLSDNGGPEKDNNSDNGVLRAGKGSLYEGGIRIPFAIQWPKKIMAGSEYKQPIISLDIFATVEANIITKAKPKKSLDGVDLIPFVTGAKRNSPHEFLFWRQFDAKNYAVLHKSGLKELILKDSNVKVYDLNADIAEELNVAAGNKMILQRMEVERSKWESGTVPPAFPGLRQADVNKPEKKAGEKD